MAHPWIAPASASAENVVERNPAGRRPRLALLSDVRGWAFCQMAHDMEQYISHVFDVEHFYVADWLQDAAGSTFELPSVFAGFDVIYCPYHRWDSPAFPLHALLPWKKTLGSLRAQWLIPERKRRPEQEEFDIVGRFAAFNVVSKRDYGDYAAGCNNLWYLTNPVNTRRFPKATMKRPVVIASWNGNAGHSNALCEDVKGFYSIVHPACARAGVQLVFAEYNTCKKQPDEMPAFYRQANVALCASLYEGASSSVAEALASGLALLSTDCGNAREMQQIQLARYGRTGIRIVERSIDGFAQELALLKHDLALVAEMGAINRDSIEQDWSWNVWAEGFIQFLLSPLRREPL